MFAIGRRKITIISLTGLLLLSGPLARAEFVISHRSAESENDPRESYNIELMTLALEKTRATYGDYQLRGMPSMNTPRSLYAASLNIYPNLLIEFSYDPKPLSKGDLTYIDFPVDLGVVGIRVCFINPLLKEKIEQVTNLEDLKKFSIGQGVGWADTEILRASGFKVIEVANYESLFKMVTAGRVDMFCRGSNEILGEYNKFKDIAGLHYDETFAIVYPLPRFYLLSSKNTLAKKRIQEGLTLAYADGSLMKLWAKYHGSSVAFTKLKQRKIFRIPNPLIKDLPKTYEQYVYDPIKQF